LSFYLFYAASAYDDGAGLAAASFGFVDGVLEGLDGAGSCFASSGSPAAACCDCCGCVSTGWRERARWSFGAALPFLESYLSVAKSAAGFGTSFGASCASGCASVSSAWACLFRSFISLSTSSG